MADISVDTTSQGYQRHLSRFRALKTYYAPIIKIYYQADEDAQKAWRRRDPLLKELLDFARRVEAQKEL